MWSSPSAERKLKEREIIPHEGSKVIISPWNDDNGHAR